MDQDEGWDVIYLQDGDAVRDESSARERKEEFFNYFYVHLIGKFSI